MIGVSWDKAGLYMNWIQRIICYWINHKWRSVKIYDDIRAWEKIKCKRCGSYAILNHSTKELLEWDQELEDLGNGAYWDKIGM